MSQHFLLSSRAKTLTLASVARMSDEEAEAVFRKIRWASNSGNPFCPKCGCTIVYDCRRANGTARWRCKACRHSFSITSGTLFHSRKMPLRAYLFAIAIFCNEVKGKSMLALSRDLGTHYMTAFVLAHKIRETMASEMRGVNIGGEGRKAEIDGGYFGGYVKPANHVENRRDRRLRQYQSGKRKVVVVIRERDGKTLPGVFASEVAALNFIRTRIAKGTELYADEAAAWNALHGRFTMHRINPSRGIQSWRWRPQQQRGELFQPHASGRNRTPSPYRRSVPDTVCAGSFMARGSSAGPERGAG
jgi:transposase-like protein